MWASFNVDRLLDEKFPKHRESRYRILHQVKF
jgi:hypothetical protein